MTIPVAPSTDAIEVFELDHVPPEEGFENVAEEPMHTGVVPLIVPGTAFTVNTFVATPQELE